jgi:predicted NUDIX family NTP pyrophosphohydrolase
MYRDRAGTTEVLLVHPGGPFWAKKDAGAWSIPKGEFDEGEDALQAALREFNEELGVAAQGTPIPLGDAKQKSGKRVSAWAIEGDLDPASITSNTFQMEWPPRSGRLQAFPEVDRAGWFGLDEARVKMNPGQHVFLERLLEHLRSAR